MGRRRPALRAPAGDDVSWDRRDLAAARRVLYQLIRQPGGARDRIFQIEFLDPGAQAFAFTFG
jgi:hypothetical protein